MSAVNNTPSKAPVQPQEKDNSCFRCKEKTHFSSRCNTYRTQLCEHFASRGTCRYGDACRHAHEKSQLRTYCEACDRTHVDNKHVPKKLFCKHCGAKDDHVLAECTWCRRCQVYDHYTDDCPNQPVMQCKSCGSDQHWTSDCTTCTNCKGNHKTADCTFYVITHGIKEKPTFNPPVPERRVKNLVVQAATSKTVSSSVPLSTATSSIEVVKGTVKK